MSDSLKAFSINVLESRMSRLDEWCRLNKTTRSGVVGLMILVFLEQLEGKQVDYKTYTEELKRK